MTINWYGEGCFKIQTNGTTILTDPVDAASTGLNAPRFKADIVIKTILPSPVAGKMKSASAPIEGEGRVIAGPGEYEVKGVRITGWPLIKDSAAGFIKTVYRLRTDELTLGLLGHLSEFNEPAILEEIDGIDILFIPTGGRPFITQEAAAKLVRQINPKVVIGSFFKIPGLKRKSDTADEFLKEIGQKVQPEEKFSAKKKDLSEKTKVVLLKI